MIRFAFFIVRTLIFIVEKLVDDLALIAALVTLGMFGSAHERLIQGSLAMVHAVRDLALGFYHNIPFSQLMSQLQAGIDQAIGGIAKNVAQDPQTALVAMVGTFFTFKLLPYFLRMARRALKRGKRRGDAPTAGAGTVEALPRHTKGEASTYDQLYRDR